MAVAVAMAAAVAVAAPNAARAQGQTKAAWATTRALAPRVSPPPMAGAATALLVFLRPLSRVPRTSGGTGAAREYKYKYKIYL